MKFKNIAEVREFVETPEARRMRQNLPSYIMNNKDCDLQLSLEYNKMAILTNSSFAPTRRVWERWMVFNMDEPAETGGVWFDVDYVLADAQ